MDNKLFVNKFQPLFLNDFEMSETMKTMFHDLIKIDKLNLLLLGDMGSGKTSILNSLIREYYKDYDYNQYNDNVLYLNSLKEQGINYYRTDVKIFCQTSSIIKNKKKIVIFDDLDLINEQCQQIFRNSIDKYSHNVHFIASCSNMQKVIESIQSRFIIVKIKQLERENLIKIIEKIKKTEHIQISENANEFVLNVSNNTVKILINYMEKFKLYNEYITLDLAMQMCTNISFISFDDYIIYLKNNKLHDAIQLLYSIYDKGYSIMDILDNFFLYIKITRLLSEHEKYIIIPYICKYITIFHNIHEEEIELALFTNNILSIFNSHTINHHLSS
uniref:AAA+ ATPase domain-containing protein n=1 Tax=viral metagenome TaxID=1070528 RepID=A0A6C0E4E7_9ZZZZ